MNRAASDRKVFTRSPRGGGWFELRCVATEHVLESPEQDVGAIHALELSFVFGTGDIIAPGGDALLDDDEQRG